MAKSLLCPVPKYKHRQCKNGKMVAYEKRPGQGWKRCLTSAALKRHQNQKSLGDKFF